MTDDEDRSLKPVPGSRLKGESERTGESETWRVRRKKKDPLVRARNIYFAPTLFSLAPRNESFGRVRSLWSCTVKDRSLVIDRKLMATSLYVWLPVNHNRYYSCPPFSIGIMPNFATRVRFPFGQLQNS